MKKILNLILLLMIVFLVGCGSQGKPAATDSKPASSPAVSPVEAPKQAAKPAEAPKPKTANNYIERLKVAGLPIGSIAVYTAENDPNKLLGRPNQYISKANFEDTTIKQINKDNPAGGSVEIFNNKQDAEKRMVYLDSLAKNGPMFVEYHYINDNVMLRLNKDLTPQQAEKYKAEFEKIK